MTTHGYALNVDLDPAPFTEWITACGLEDAAFTTMARELGRPITVDEVRPAAAAAIAEVFGLELAEHEIARRVRGSSPPSALALVLCATALGSAGANRRPPARRSSRSSPKVKRTTKVPVLLPPSLPLLGNYKVYASGFGDRRPVRPRARRRPELPRRERLLRRDVRRAARRQAARSGQNARLANGDPAAFHPVTCGGSCSPNSFWFIHNGYLYSWQAKDLRRAERRR